MATSQDVLLQINKTLDESLKNQVLSNLKLKEMVDRPALLAKQVELNLAHQKSQATIGRAVQIETARQRGAGIGEKIGGLFGAKGAEVGGAVGGGIGGGVGTAMAALGPAMGAAGAAITAFKSVVLDSVAKANPGAMERFNLALDDIQGVIGQTLMPVIEMWTKELRLVGDVLASILPSADEMRDALQPVSDFLDDLREALEPVVPVIKQVLLGALKALGEALKLVLKPLGEVAKFLGHLFGEGAGSLKSSFAAAVRNVSFTSAEQFARSVNVAAFRSGMGGATTPIDHIRGKVDEAVVHLGKISGTVSGIAGVLGAVGGQSKDIEGVPGWLNTIIDVIPGGKIGKAGINWAGEQMGFGKDTEIDKGESFKNLNIARTSHAQTSARIARGDLSGFADQNNALAYLKSMEEKMRKMADQVGISREDIENEIQRHLDQAKRRGMDGHPGGA